MNAGVLSALAAAALLALFLWFSHASFTRFNPRRASLGNSAVRLASLIAVALLMLAWWRAAPGAGRGAAALACALTSAVLMRGALAALGPVRPDVAFTGEGPDRLITKGIYGRLRNPLYAAYLAHWLGWAVLLAPLVWPFAVFAGFLVAYHMAARSEEAFLSARFGAAYDAYRAGTGRLTPRLRPVAVETQAGASE